MLNVQLFHSMSAVEHWISFAAIYCCQKSCSGLETTNALSWSDLDLCKGKSSKQCHNYLSDVTINPLIIIALASQLLNGSLHASGVG